MMGKIRKQGRMNLPSSCSATEWIAAESHRMGSFAGTDACLVQSGSEVCTVAVLAQGWSRHLLSNGLIYLHITIAYNLWKGAIPNTGPLGKGQGRKEVP